MNRGRLMEDFFILALFASFGMMVLISAHSLLTVYLGLELLSLSLYAMVAMDRDSVGPTIYSAFRRELEWTLFEHILGPLVGEAISSGGRGAPMHLAQLRAKFIIDAINNDITLLPDGHNWRSLFTDAFSKGITWLKVTLGSDMSLWKWGKIHATKPSHTLSSAFPELSTLLDPPSVPMNDSTHRVIPDSR